jgi:hypothetical protein
MRRSLVVVALLVVAGCQDQGPRLRDGGALPQFSHLQTNPMFGFLSPVPPGTTLPTGEFHAYAAPEVSICRETGTGCDLLVTATLTTSTTHSGSSTLDLVSIPGSKDQYQTNWRGLNALRNASPNDVYRIKVRAAPLSGGSLQFMGQARVTLGTSTSSDVVEVSGNTLPVKFLILIGAFCVDDDCTEALVSGEDAIPFADNGGNYLGIEVLDDDFIDCTMAGDNCPSEVHLTVSRYKGPDRCIPLEGNTIQWETCVTVRTIPYGVKFQPNTVKITLCFDPRAESYVDSKHARLLKQREDKDGNILANHVVDLNGELTPDSFFDCGDDFEPEVFQTGSMRGDDVFSRLAARTANILRPMAALLAPRPLHAKRRTGFKVSSSVDGFSRIGLAMPVVAHFGPATISGLENTLLPDASQPWARVLGTQFADFCETHPDQDYPCTPAVYPAIFADRGVHDVRVEFAVLSGGGSVPAGPVLTNGEGYAKASWTLGPASQNPQQLKAKVGYPTPFLNQNGNFENPQTPWATHTFTATALEYAVFFLSPLGNDGSTGPNVTNIAPRVRVCGPLADPANATAEPGQTCVGNVHVVLPNPVLKSGAWETPWKSDKATVTNSLYRIDVFFGNAGDGSQPAIGSVLARRGGGGGGIDPDGTYQFQNGANIPVKFKVNVPNP